MSISQDIIDFEEPLRSIIGDSIKKVKYFEIDGDDPHFQRTDHHSIDFGLEFTLEERKIYFIWDSQRVQFDLKYAFGEIRGEFNPQVTIAEHDLSQDESWKELLSTKIKEVRSFWGRMLSAGIDYPKDVELVFEHNKSVFISVTEIWERNQALGFADCISIFFDRKTAMQYGVGN